MARLQLLVGGWRVGIVAAEVLQARAELVDLPPDARGVVGGERLRVSILWLIADERVGERLAFLALELLAYLREQRIQRIRGALRLDQPRAIFRLQPRQVLPLRIRALLDLADAPLLGELLRLQLTQTFA